MKQITVSIRGTEQTINALPCPFCGSSDLLRAPWYDDDGQYDAIECAACKGSAPAEIWNTRTKGENNGTPSA